MVDSMVCRTVVRLAELLVDVLGFHLVDLKDGLLDPRWAVM